MAKGERDWAQLDAFEAEYKERLEAERKRGRASDSQYLTFLNRLARGRETFWSDEVTARDSETGRLFALRTKILALREKLGEKNGEPLLPVEAPFAGDTSAHTARSYDDRYDPEKGDLQRTNNGRRKEKAENADVVGRIRFLTDPAPAGYVYPVTYDDVRAVLRELPKEHAATVHEIRLSNQRRTGADGDWLDGEIRLHCLIREDGRRPMGRTETTMDVQRFGGAFEWHGNKLWAVWPLDAYKTFVLRRVLIHEVAHGVAELPGMADRIRRAGSVEKFCEQYAENFYRPAGKSVRLGF